MEKLKKIGLALLDFVEVVMPVMALLVIFGSFIVNVVSRYVFKSPVNACYELCLAGLVWCLFLSAPHAARKHNNVAFTLLYDKLNPLGQLICRLAGNGFLIFCFGIMLYPCSDWIFFMARRFTAVLHIRMSIIYAPFIVFNVLTLCHLLYDFILDVILLVKVITGKAKLEKANNEEIEGGAEA